MKPEFGSGRDRSCHMIFLRYLTIIVIVMPFIFTFPIVPAAGAAEIGSQAASSGIISKLERMQNLAVEDIRKYEAEIEKSQGTLKKSQNIMSQAQQKGNAQVEKIAREALTTAQEAKRKNEGLKRAAELRKKRADAALDYVRSGGAEPEVKLEQVEFENMNDLWVQRQKHLIEQRLKEPNPYAGKIYRSLKTNAPRRMSGKKCLGGIHQLHRRGGSRLLSMRAAKLKETQRL